MGSEAARGVGLAAVGLALGTVGRPGRRVRVEAPAGAAGSGEDEDARDLATGVAPVGVTDPAADASDWVWAVTAGLTDEVEVAPVVVRA